MKNTRTYYYSVNGTVIADDTPEAHAKYMLYKDAQERADRTKSRNLREYRRKIVEQKYIGCSLIVAGLVNLALSVIVIECLPCALITIPIGVAVSTTDKIII